MAEVQIEAIKKVSFKKGDILFLRVKEQLTDQQYTRLNEEVKKMLPEGVKVLLCEGIEEIGIISEEER